MSSYVYFARSDFGDAIKIGVSRDPKKRAAFLNAALIGVVHMDDSRSARDLEKRIHARLDAWRIQGEWFQPNFHLHRLLDTMIASPRRVETLEELMTR